MTRDLFGPTYHRDGTVTYWSVYLQRWIGHVASISDRELAAMGSGEREKVQRHIARARVTA